MFRRFLAIAVLTIPLSCALTASAAAATRFVATSGSDEGNTCLSAAQPCQTVQMAIATAEPGDTVSIAAGTYIGEFKLNKPLTIVGQGPSTVLEGSPTVQRPVYIQSSVSLENLTVRGGLNGSEAKDAIFIGGTGSQVSLVDVVAEQAPTAYNGRNAVYVSTGNTLTMKGSTIRGVGTTCLWVSGSATLTESSIAMTPGLGGGAALRTMEGGTASLVDTTVTDSGEMIPNQGERGSALNAEGGMVTATDSTFSGPQSVAIRRGTVVLIRDRVMAHEAGVVLHGGAITEIRDSLIAPSPGGVLGADVMVETEASATPPRLTVVGSTLYANGSTRYREARAILAYSPMQALIVNTILQATAFGGDNIVDIEKEEGGTWSITHSAFTKVAGTGLPAPGSATNIAAIPVFAGQQAGDYRLTIADAPLIAAGDPAQVNPGETDLAGDPRVLPTSDCNGSPDIGAYELVRMIICPQPPPAGPSPSLSGPGTSPQQPESATQANSANRIKPKLSGVRVKDRRHWPKLEFHLNEPAKVTVTILKGIGRRGGTDGKYARYRPVAEFDDDVAAGRSLLPINTGLRSARLDPGVYLLTVIATVGGLNSARHTVSAFEYRGP
jgi:hypothetical protein